MAERPSRQRKGGENVLREERQRVEEGGGEGAGRAARSAGEKVRRFRSTRFRPRSFFFPFIGNFLPCHFETSDSPAPFSTPTSINESTIVHPPTAVLCISFFFFFFFSFGFCFFLFAFFFLFFPTFFFGLISFRGLPWFRGEKRRGKEKRSETRLKYTLRGNEFEAHYRSSLRIRRGVAGYELESLCACSFRFYFFLPFCQRFLLVSFLFFCSLSLLSTVCFLRYHTAR